MQTLKFDLRLQVTAIVPESFLQEIITEASGQGDKEPTVFLKKLHDEFMQSQLGDTGITYDAACDTLTAAVLTNALRKALQAQTSMFLVSSGLGCRVSPVEVLGIESVQPRTDSKSLAAPQPERTKGQPLSQGAAVQALVDARDETAPRGQQFSL